MAYGKSSYIILFVFQGTLNVSELSSTDICLITKDGFTLLMKAVLGNQLPTVRALLNTTGCPMDFRQMKVRIIIGKKIMLT